jgi:hypothetical protein
MYIYIYISIYICLCVYIYVYIKLCICIIIRNNVYRSTVAKSHILLQILLDVNPAFAQYNNSYESLYFTTAGFAFKSVPRRMKLFAPLDLFTLLRIIYTYTQLNIRIYMYMYIYLYIYIHTYMHACK